jgi:hypothetical protein
MGSKGPYFHPSHGGSEEVGVVDMEPVDISVGWEVGEEYLSSCFAVDLNALPYRYPCFEE